VVIIATVGISYGLGGVGGLDRADGRNMTALKSWLIPSPTHFFVFDNVIEE
jgi:hypothetical protein